MARVEHMYDYRGEPPSASEEFDTALARLEADLTVSPAVETQRCIRVAVLGVPNAGKSSLVNALCDAKVSAVSRKTNTTRGVLMGAHTEGSTQVVFYDMPGVVGRESVRDWRQGQQLKLSWSYGVAADVLMVVVDAERHLRRPDGRVVRLVAGLEENMARYAGDSGERPAATVLALTKADMLTGKERGRLLEQAMVLKDLHDFTHVVMLSSATGKNVSALRDTFRDMAGERRWDIEAGTPTERGHVGVVMETVREVMFDRLNEEVPYEVELVFAGVEEFRNGSVKFEVDMLVANERYKPIIIGENGAVIGQIGIRARKELEEYFGRRVHLILKCRLHKKMHTRRLEAFEKELVNFRASLPAPDRASITPYPLLQGERPVPYPLLKGSEDADADEWGAEGDEPELLEGEDVEYMDEEGEDVDMKYALSDEALDEKEELPPLPDEESDELVKEIN